MSRWLNNIYIVIEVDGLEKANGITQFTMDEVKNIIRTEDYIVLDVRTQEEYEEGHIPHVPLRPMQEVMEWANDLDRSQKYLLVCRSGGRSQKVAEYLQEQGLSVANGNGGMLDWHGDFKLGAEE